MVRSSAFILCGLSNIFAAATASDLNITSILEVAVSHTSSLILPTGRPILPLPPHVENEPAYEAILPLLAGPPIVQQAHADSVLLVDKAKRSLMEGLDGIQKRDVSGRANAMRVLVVGDSITQGQQGDYTWRYRLWQWFRQQSVAVQFVGPYTGTFLSSTGAVTGAQNPPQPPPLYSSNGAQSADNSGSISVNGYYARSVDSAFLQSGGYNHFANWGRAMATDQSLIANVLQQTPADLILLALGFNDMGCHARSVNPNIKIAIANVPQRTFIRPDLVSSITTYNNILPSYISKWTTAQSPLHLVEFQQNYACGTTDCPAAYDGLHPNAWGEFQIAQAFSKSLIAGFGIGSTPLAIPAQNDASVIRQIDTPTNFKVFSSPQGVSATWDAVYGAYSYDVSVSINGGGSGWSAGGATVNRWDSQWPLAGWSYAVSVRASCGNQHSGNTSTLTATATPQLAPPPTNINVQPISDGFTVTFAPPTGQYTDNIIEYNIIFWDTNPNDCQFIGGAAFKNSPATIHGLLPGRSYLVAPLTWNANGQGLPTGAHNVIPGSANVPAVPSNLNIVSNDATSVHLSWNASPGAAGYEVFWRNKTGGPYISLANTTSPCMDDYFLFPGSWNYQFCVAAWNGNLESGPGPAVIAPSPASTVTPGSPGPTCAGPAQWCPAYGQPYSGPAVGGCAGCGGGGGSSVSYSSTQGKVVTTLTTTATTTTTAALSRNAYTCSTTTKHTVVSGTPYLVCGTSSTRDPSPSPYSFQAQFTGNIAYGNIYPTDIVSAMSTACTGGCNGDLATSTTTGYIVSKTNAPQQSATFLVPYVVTDQQVPDQSYSYFISAVMAIVKTEMTSETFDWTSFSATYLPNGQTQYNSQDMGNTTMWHGPQYVQGVRWAFNHDTGDYSIQAGTFGYSVTSYQQQSSIDCDTLAGPISAALGAIPEVGPVFGVIGSTVCSVIKGASGSKLRV